MNTLRSILFAGVIAALILVGCQGSSSQLETSQSPSSESQEDQKTDQKSTVLEETFESGNTGDLSSTADETPGGSEQEQGNP